MKKGNYSTLQEQRTARKKIAISNRICSEVGHY
jgi:hypothetical protein